MKNALALLIMLFAGCKHETQQEGYFVECIAGSKGAINSYYECYNFKQCKSAHLTDKQCTEAMYEHREYQLKLKQAESGALLQ